METPARYDGRQPSLPMFESPPLSWRERMALLRILDVAINNAPVAGVTKEECQAIRQKVARL